MLVFLALFIAIQVTSYLMVTAYVRAGARDTVAEELRLASALFKEQLEIRSRQLVTATRLLSGDFALKTAAATSDHATTSSVLDNHRRRADADLLWLASLDGAVLAASQRPAQHGAPFPAPRLLAEADSSGQAVDVVAVDGRLYRLAVVPLLAPEPIAWLAAGFAIDDRTAADLRRLTELHVSFLARQGDRFVVHASTLDAAGREALARGLPAGGRAPRGHPIEAADNGNAKPALGATHVLQVTVGPEAVGVEVREVGDRLRVALGTGREVLVELVTLHGDLLLEK